MDKQGKSNLNIKKLVSKNGNKYTRVLIFDFDEYVYESTDGKKFLKLLIFDDSISPGDFLLSKPRENFEDKGQANASDDFEF